MDPKIRFINPNAAPPKPRSSFAEVREVWLEIRAIVLTFACITLICAILFYIGTGHGWGLQPSFNTTGIAPGLPGGPSRVGFFDCVYFSVVTIASLGYGDYRPESYGRLIAIVEVLSGLVLMGLFLSHLVSRQQERLTRRLVRGQLNVEIQDFRDQLTELTQTFKESQVPIEQRQASPWLHKASGLALSIARYWRYEAKEPGIGELIPERPADRLLIDMAALLELVSLHVKELTRASLHPDDLRYILSVTDSTLSVAAILSERMEHDGLKHTRDRVIATVESLRVQFELHVRK